MASDTSANSRRNSMSNYSTGEDRIVQCQDCGSDIQWRRTNDGRLNRKGNPLSLPYNVTPGPEINQQHKCRQYLERIAKQNPASQGRQFSQYQKLPNRQKSEGLKCFKCQGPIMFSKDQINPATGKPMMLEMDGSTPHQHRAQVHSSYTDTAQPWDKEESGSGQEDEEQF